ncbi:MAG: hypothetical protein MGU50_10560 [Trichodesmium sp. MAG_R02]|jgi:hypothetical protein|nr:hypothetical protein [Trichodesmium sp. MAG_R02]
MKTYSVIMLGPRGFGKTVFLASMYKKLSTQGKLDFFLKVKGTEKRKRLNHIYTELAIGEKWPKGTDPSEVSEWEFTCCVQTKDLSTYDVCKFVYIDYAGGRITETNESLEEDEEFNEKIEKADIMLVLLDGQRLCNLMGQDKSDKAVFGQILSDVKKQIKLDSIMVFDSALLSLEKIQLISNLKWITRVPITLKKAREIIESYLEKVKVSPETDPEIQEITREFQKKDING